MPVTDKLKSDVTANNELGLHFEHHQHKGLNNRAENSHRQRFASTHDLLANLFMRCRHTPKASAKRATRVQAFAPWDRVSCTPMMAFTTA